ncbi:uncharacterized protein LOC107266554 isoform X2 [Cephus cinctus]|uniref:Uncharacterized protein LOC107266554 isoform X2 n=1 Tax=Cephus cinctus TaxID=211228 RepID=A0AAJ7RFY8_CEPCN|nr:uncharacterized protein LOC107266554 isoform X2 [Cephus cinctus]
MSRIWILISILGVVTIGIHGFTMERGNYSSWDVVPSLEAEQRGSFERILNGKMQVTGMDKVLQSSDSRKPVEHVEDSIPEGPQREKRSEVLIKFVNDTGDKDEIIPLGNVEPANKDTENIPKNVVLLLTDMNGQDAKSAWENFQMKYEFSAHGLLQSCLNADPLSMRYTMGDQFVGKQDNDCGCERHLKSNLGTLLSWAHRFKEMTTGAVSATNFTISPTLPYDGPTGIGKDFNKVQENMMKSEIRRPKIDFRDSWHYLDADKHTSSPATGSSGSPTTTTLKDGPNSFDGMWDVFDMFSRIRLAFFRTLLDSLSSNWPGAEDEFSPRRPFPLQANLVDLLGDTIKELKSVSSDKGFILVAAAPGNEISGAVDLLQREITKDTLLIVVGMCTGNEKLVPYYASGPGSKALYKAVSIWALPLTVKDILGITCSGTGCRKRRHDVLTPDNPIPPHDDKSVPHKKVVRAENASDENDDDVTTTEKNGSPLALNGQATVTLLGLATSTVATLALSS